MLIYFLCWEISLVHRQLYSFQASLITLLSKLWSKTIFLPYWTGKNSFSILTCWDGLGKMLLIFSMILWNTTRYKLIFHLVFAISSTLNVMGMFTPPFQIHIHFFLQMLWFHHKYHSWYSSFLQEPWGFQIQWRLLDEVCYFVLLFLLYTIYYFYFMTYIKFWNFFIINFIELELIPDGLLGFGEQKVGRRASTWRGDNASDGVGDEGSLQCGGGQCRVVGPCEG